MKSRVSCQKTIENNQFVDRRWKSIGQQSIRSENLQRIGANGDNHSKTERDQVQSATFIDLQIIKFIFKIEK